VIQIHGQQGVTLAVETSMRAVNWRIFIVVMLVFGVGAWAIHHWLHIPFWATFAIVIFGLLVNGWIAAVEDHW
jgi:hypothetical protein